MPKYKVRKFKEPTFDQFTTLLARLTPEQLKHVQDISRHFQGEDVGFGNAHRTPPRKVLPGVWEDIQSATSGAHLVGGLVSEYFEHRDNPHFHRGGGLWDGLASIFHTGVNYLTSAVQPLGWMQDVWDYSQGYKHAKRIPTEYRQRVDGVQQAKLPEAERASTLHGWKLDPDLSSGRVAVYIDESKKEIHTVIRGTNKKNIVDLATDAKILFTGSPMLYGTQDTLVAVAKKYGATYDLDCTGYSLGGTQLTKIFTDKQSPEDQAMLDKYTDLVLVNPGGSPFTGDDPIKQILADERVTLLSNRSDILSSIYTRHSDPSRTYYGEHSWGAFESHDAKQFGTDTSLWRPSGKAAVSTTQAMEALGYEPGQGVDRLIFEADEPPDPLQRRPRPEETEVEEPEEPEEQPVGLI